MKIRFWMLTVTAFLLFSCNTLQKYTRTDEAMSTILTVSVFSDNKAKADKILDESFKIAFELQEKLSWVSGKGVIYQLNHDKKMTVTDPLILSLIKDSVSYAEITGGLFDPTVYPLVRLWGFSTDSKQVPSPEAIREAQNKIGYQNVKISGNEVSLENGVAFDLGASAKKRIIRQIADYIRSQGISLFLVNGGGDLIVSGLYQNQRLWNIAVADPFKKKDIFGTLKVRDCFVISSGDYERFFIDNGKRYHHIIDPRSGYPTDNGVHSTTIVTRNPATAEYLSTALMVMGIPDGMKFLEKHTDTEAIFISGTEDKPVITCTPGIVMTEKTDGTYEFTLKEYEK